MNQPAQQQPVPGTQAAMTPIPDCGETSYLGSAAARRQGRPHHRRRQRHRPRRRDRLRPRRRRRADLLPQRGRRRRRTRRATSRRPAARPCSWPATSPTQSTAATSSTEAVDEFGRLDILVNNAAFQMTHESLEDIRRRVGLHLRDERRRVVPSDQGRRAAHDAGLVDHRQLVGELRHALARRSLRTRRPRPRSRTSAPAWPSCSARRASASTAWRPARSGRR